MLVTDGILVQRTQFARSRFRENRREDTALGKALGASAQLHHVALHRSRDLTHRSHAEEIFPRQAALKSLVFESIGRISREPHFPAELLGGPDAALKAYALQGVETDHLRIRSVTQLARLPIPVDNHIDGIVDIVIQRHVLDGIHHVVDVLLLLGKLVRPDGIPIRLVLVQGIFRHLYIAAYQTHARLLDAIKGRLAVLALPRAQERNHLGRILFHDREIGINLIHLPEPDGILDQAGFLVYHQVTHPVHIGSLLQLAMHFPQGEVLAVDGHLPVKGRGGDGLDGMEADLPRLAPVDMKAVDQEIIVVHQAHPR